MCACACVCYMNHETWKSNQLGNRKVIFSSKRKEQSFAIPPPTTTTNVKTSVVRYEWKLSVGKEKIIDDNTNNNNGRGKKSWTKNIGGDYMAHANRWKNGIFRAPAELISFHSNFRHMLLSKFMFENSWEIAFPVATFPFRIDIAPYLSCFSSTSSSTTLPSVFVIFSYLFPSAGNTKSWIFLVLSYIATFLPPSKERFLG